MSADRTKPAGAFCGHCEQPLWDASDHAPWCSMSETQSTTRSTPEGLREALSRTANALHNAAAELHQRNAPNADDYADIARGAFAALSAPSPAEPAKGSGELETIIRDLYAEYQADETGDSALLYELIERAHDALSRRTVSEVPQGWRDAGEVCDMVIAAFQAGCEAVHANYQPDPDPNFYEAACDYAASVIAAAPPPEGRG